MFFLQTIIFASDNIIFSNGFKFLEITSKNNKVVVEDQEIRLPLASYVGLHDNNKIRNIPLSQNTSIRIKDHLFTFSKWLELDSSGKLIRGVNAKNSSISVHNNIIPLQEGVVLGFYENGKIENIFFSPKTPVELKIGNKKWSFGTNPANDMTYLFFGDADAYIGGFLDKDLPYNISNKIFTIAQGKPITIYPNGEIRTFHTAKNETISTEKTSIKLNAGDLIVLDETGKITSWNHLVW